MSTMIGISNAATAAAGLTVGASQLSAATPRPPSSAGPATAVNWQAYYQYQQFYQQQQQQAQMPNHIYQRHPQQQQQQPIQSPGYVDDEDQRQYQLYQHRTSTSGSQQSSPSELDAIPEVFGYRPAAAGSWPDDLPDYNRFAKAVFAATDSTSDCSPGSPTDEGGLPPTTVRNYADSPATWMRQRDSTSVQLTVDVCDRVVADSGYIFGRYSDSDLRRFDLDNAEFSQQQQQQNDQLIELCRVVSRTREVEKQQQQQQQQLQQFPAFPDSQLASLLNDNNEPPPAVPQLQPRRTSETSTELQPVYNNNSSSNNNNRPSSSPTELRQFVKFEQDAFCRRGDWQASAAINQVATGDGIYNVASSGRTTSMPSSADYGVRVAGCAPAVAGPRSAPLQWSSPPSAQTAPTVLPVKVTPSTSIGKTRTRDKYRTVYTEPQRIELEAAYQRSSFIDAQRKANISAAVGLSERQIKIWFQNRRAKDRRQRRRNDAKLTSSSSRKQAAEQMEEDGEEEELEECEIEDRRYVDQSGAVIHVGAAADRLPTGSYNYVCSRRSASSPSGSSSSSSANVRQPEVNYCSGNSLPLPQQQQQQQPHQHHQQLLLQAKMAAGPGAATAVDFGFMRTLQTQLNASEMMKYYGVCS